MKRIQSKAGLLKKRVNTVHSRAQFAGISYLLGILLLLAATVVCPMLRNVYVYGEKPFAVAHWYMQLTTLFQKGFGVIFKTPDYIIHFAQLLIYFVLLIVLLVNLVRALCRLNWLFKKRASYINGFNRNMYAMDKLGKFFSSSFAAVVICNLLLVWITPSDTPPTWMALITCVVALIIRFVIGALEGLIPLFTSGKKIVEKKRDHGVRIYFIRNVVQVVLLCSIIYFFTTVSGFATGVYSLLNQAIVGGEPSCFVRLDALPIYVEMLAIICLMFLLKHATASTEYHRACNRTLGINNFAVFSFVLALVIGALIVFPFAGVGFPDGEDGKVNMYFVWATLIAVLGFLFDCICRPRDKKRIEDETDEDPIPGDEEDTEDTASLQPQVVLPYGNIGAPILMPIVYGYPQQQGVAPITPTPAPEYLTPTPSPQALEEGAEDLDNGKEVKTTNRKFKVHCPQCGKALMASEAAAYHRCPSCDKVFQLRKVNKDE